MYFKLALGPVYFNNISFLGFFVTVDDQKKKRTNQHDKFSTSGTIPFYLSVLIFLFCTFCASLLWAVYQGPILVTSCLDLCEQVSVSIRLTQSRQGAACQPLSNIDVLGTQVCLLPYIHENPSILSSKMEAYLSKMVNVPIQMQYFIYWYHNKDIKLSIITTRLMLR